MDRGHDQIAPWRRSAALSVILGTLLIALSVPGVRREAYIIGARDTLDRLEAGPPPAGDEPREFAETMGAFAGSAASARADAMAARAWIAMAAQANLQPRDREAALRTAGAFQAAGLALAPADQYGWQRLSHVLAERNDWIAAAKAWQMGMFTGPFEPTIMPVKFESGLALWRYMDLPQRAAFGDLAGLFVRTQPDVMIALTRRFGAEATIRDALADRQELRTFEEALAARREP